MLKVININRYSFSNGRISCFYILDFNHFDLSLTSCTSLTSSFVENQYPGFWAMPRGSPLRPVGLGWRECLPLTLLYLATRWL